MNIQAQSWQDITLAQPLDPRSIILNCSVAGAGGAFARSTTFLQPSWGTNPFAFTGSNTNVTSLDSTDASTTVDAAQWSFAHQMVNGSSALGPALRKMIFLRAGRLWQNNVELNLGGANYTDVQLSLRDNLGTSGTFLNGSAGTIPVVAFPGTLTGTVILRITIFQPGVYSMVIVANNAGTYSTFEMEWVVLP